MDYLLKASGLVIIFYLFYYIFLKNETFFNSIRGYFLIGLLIVVSIPLIEIPIYIETITTQIKNVNFQEIATKSYEESINWIKIFTITYVIGVLFFSFKFILQLFSLGILISKHKIVKQGKYSFIETTKNISPFSFFNIIIYNKTHFSVAELEQVIHHEKTHVIQWHSLDTILAHLLVITLWFNPFVWLYKKAIQQNLEFLADAYAHKKAKNQKQYQLTLLKTSSTNHYTAITTNFYNSLIKKRIMMLHKNPSKNKNQLKYIFLVPILIAFVSTFNTKIVAQEKSVYETTKNENDTLIQKETIMIKSAGDNEIVWVKKNEEGSKIKITGDDNGASKSNKAFFIGSNSNEKPLIIVDGKEISQNEMDAINPDNIKSINVIKGSSATEKYGDKGNNGAIEITKKENSTSKNVFFVTDDKNTITAKNNKTIFFKSSDSKEKPLIIVDGKEISQEEMNAINPDNIKSINVLKDSSATEKYGDKGNNGVIEITTKQ